METPADGEDCWNNRKDNIVKIIQTYDFDIMGLQEVKENQLKDLKKMPEYTYFGLGRSNDNSNEYNPIFYKKDKLNLLEFDTFWLSKTQINGKKEDRWNADYPRICTWGRFQVKQSGKEFYVFNTHFDHRSEEARYQSAKLLSQKISTLEFETPVFLLGDFNGETNERFYQILSHEWRNVVEESPYHVGPKKTCTGVGFNHELKWDEYDWIDYIFVNNHSIINKTIIITDQFYGRYPSDHFAVCLEATLG